MELFKHIEPTAFATVILPLAMPKPLTFHIPDELIERVKFGIRVEVQMGKGRDLYSAVVIGVSSEKPEYPTKPILQIIDDELLSVAVSNPTFFAVFPSVTKGFVYCKSSVQSEATLRIINMAGIVMETIPSFTNGQLIDISSMPSGEYFVLLQTPNALFEQRIILIK